jgi:hypothetical protein
VNVRPAIRLFVIAGMLAVGTLVLPAPAARACSCASVPGERPEPPLAFEGTAVQSLPMSYAAHVWRFHVVRAERGAEPGTDVDVAVMVPEVTPQGTTSSSCDISSSPMQPGARYRVSAYASEPNGERHFFANQCGGSLDLVSSTYARSRLPGADGGSSRSDPTLAFGVAVVAASAATTVLMRRRARRPLTDA